MGLEPPSERGPSEASTSVACIFCSRALGSYRRDPQAPARVISPRQSTDLTRRASRSLSRPWPIPPAGNGRTRYPKLGSERVLCSRVCCFAAFYEASGASARSLSRSLPRRHQSPPRINTCQLHYTPIWCRRQHPAHLFSLARGLLRPSRRKSVRSPVIPSNRTTVSEVRLKRNGPATVIPSGARNLEPMGRSFASLRMTNCG